MVEEMKYQLGMEEENKIKAGPPSKKARRVRYASKYVTEDKPAPICLPIDQVQENDNLDFMISDKGVITCSSLTHGVSGGALQCSFETGTPLQSTWKKWGCIVYVEAPVAFLNLMDNLIMRHAGAKGYTGSVCVLSDRQYGPRLKLKCKYANTSPDDFKLMAGDFVNSFTIVPRLYCMTVEGNVKVGAYYTVLETTPLTRVN